MHFWHVMYAYRYVTFIMAVPTWNLVWATSTQDQKGQHPITSLLVYNSSTENLTEKEHNQRFSTWTKTWGVKKLSTPILAEMLRRHSKRTEDKSGAGKTSLQMQTKRQGQTSEANARHKLRVCQGKYSLALPLAPFHGCYLGLIKYHKSRVPLYGAPTVCMMM